VGWMIGLILAKYNIIVGWMIGLILAKYNIIPFATLSD
jgi:hypothetical protein